MSLLRLYGFSPSHRARCGSAASVRAVCGVPESDSAGWMALGADERTRLFERAELELRAEPGLTVFGAERRHGIPRNYLRRRLKAKADRRRSAN